MLSSALPPLKRGSVWIYHLNMRFAPAAAGDFLFIVNELHYSKVIMNLVIIPNEQGILMNKN